MGLLVLILSCAFHVDAILSPSKGHNDMHPAPVLATCNPPPPFFARLSKYVIHANRHDCKKVLRSNPGVKCARRLTTKSPHRVGVLKWD